jgi:1-acyl-sn-glycerol-3-phosphate acyltransferase
MTGTTWEGVQPSEPEGGWPKDHRTFWPWWVCAPILFLFIGIMARTVVRNSAALPATGPLIIASNHVSVIDPTYLIRAFWKQGRLARFRAKASIWTVPLVGEILSRSGQSPVDRRGGAAASLRAAQHLVETGSMVIVYPEGTLTRDPGHWPMKGKTGAARLALESGVPIIPIAHWGAQQILPPYGRLRPFPRRTVTVLIGEPLDLSPWHGRPIDSRTLAEVTDVIMDAITALQAELRGEQPPLRRWDMAVDGDPYHPKAKR